MSERILDYKYDRSRSAKDEVEGLLKRPDARSILNCVTVESLVMGLDGQTYVAYKTVSLKELADRSYLIHWGFQYPCILYTDTAHLPKDIRTYNTENNNIAIHQLNVMEQAMMKTHFKTYLKQNHKSWGQVDTVKAKCQ